MEISLLSEDSKMRKVSGNVFDECGGILRVTIRGDFGMWAPFFSSRDGMTHFYHPLALLSGRNGVLCEEFPYVIDHNDDILLMDSVLMIPRALKALGGGKQDLLVDALYCLSLQLA